jgi:hypothetical protein
VLREVEPRLRPGGSSRIGFLGEEESLAAVVEHDRQVLSDLGLTHERLAVALDELTATVKRVRHDLLAKAKGPTAEYFTRADVPWFDPYQPTSTPEFSLASLPDTRTGYLVGHLHIFVRQYRGLQGCPGLASFIRRIRR